MMMVCTEKAGKRELQFTEYLLHARHCAMHFLAICLFGSHETVHGLPYSTGKTKDLS